MKIKSGESRSIFYIFLVGIIAGFAFSIKFTALLFIAGILAVISFSRLGLLGLFGYISIFIGVFTAGNLWKMMNVVINPNSIEGFERNIGLSLILTGIFLLVYGILKNKDSYIKYLKEIGIFFLGLFIVLSPWISKNLYEIDKLSLSGILSGSSKGINLDLESIHSKEKIAEIKENTRIENLKNKNSITTDEDLLRYFGYEKGILNHIKMPWNISMQKNQGGEFTDIGFLFLAFIPLAFIFLPFRRKNLFIPVILYAIFAFIIFKYGLFSNFLSNLVLPYGYLLLFTLYVIPTLFFIFTLKDSRKNYVFILNLIFTFFYVFLWNISSFGIVWYGITMYFSFLLVIGLGLHGLISYKVDECEDDILIKQVGSIIALLIIFIFIFNSVIPNTLNNLKNAGYKEYKTGDVSQVEAKYLYHRDYLAILFNLNIAENKREDFLKNNIDKHILTAVEGIEKADINKVFSVLKQLYKNPNFSKQARVSLDNIFDGISNPEDIYKNRSYVYRIGTFLKYHISENNERLLEDNLVIMFDDYIYDENTNNTINNFKKLGFSNILVDLNAATIDKSDDHGLTNRYEKLLKTFTSDKLELVETDSVCLRIGLDSYRQNKKLDDFMILAGVNYESYTDDNKEISRSDKYLTCLKYIDYLIENKAVNDTYYSYLLPYANYMNQEDVRSKLENEQSRLAILNKIIPKSYKVLFEIK